MSISAQNSLSLVGRTLIAILFLPAGFVKISQFTATVGFIATAGVPLPEVAAALAIAFDLGLGLLLLIGWQARWAALGLAIYTTVITFIFHNFWASEAAQVMPQMQAFFKNFAAVGGLLLAIAFGPGGWSVDARRQYKLTGTV